MRSLSSFFLLFGFIFILLGVIISLASKVTWLGRLPGDIIIKKENFTFIFPLTTCLGLSLGLSLLLWLIFKLLGR
ncbi:MAG: DUF2905 domain-containing protein [Candidatus Aminicenantes bacterium]|nr:DUF2905 domain-containing protein [Candidatus Aminicenantes bacterium]